MVSHSPSLRRSDHHVQDVIAMSGAESDAQNPVCVYYYTLLHITAYITFICPSHPSSGGCLWFGLEIRGPSRSAIAMAVATAPIAKTTTLPALIQANLKGAGDGCPTYFVNSWALAAGLVPRLLKCNEV